MAALCIWEDRVIDPSASDFNIKRGRFDLRVVLSALPNPLTFSLISKGVTPGKRWKPSAKVERNKGVVA